MTIDEAIKNNSALAKELDIPERAKERASVQLGIEALWRYLHLRQAGVLEALLILPGETKD